MKIHGRRGSSLRRPSLCSRKSRGHLQRNRDIRSIFPHPRSSCRKLRPEQGPPHWANISHRRDQRRPGQIVWCRATARIPGQRDVATHPSARAGRAVNSISNSNPPHGCTLLTILLIPSPLTYSLVATPMVEAFSGSLRAPVAPTRPLDGPRSAKPARNRPGNGLRRRTE